MALSGREGRTARALETLSPEQSTPTPRFNLAAVTVGMPKFAGDQRSSRWSCRELSPPAEEETSAQHHHVRHAVDSANSSKSLE
jgi:hypothetical protein